MSKHKMYYRPSTPPPPIPKVKFELDDQMFNEGGVASVIAGVLIVAVLVSAGLILLAK